MRIGLVVLVVAAASCLLAAAGLLTAAPEDSCPSAPLVRAHELFEARRFRDAERLLVGRSSADARWLLARCYVEQGLLEDARDLLEELVAEKPDARRLLVGVCLDRGDVDRAIPHLRTLLAEDPKDLSLRKVLAQCEARSGNVMGALAVANEGLKQAPADGDLGAMVADLSVRLSQAVVPPAGIPNPWPPHRPAGIRSGNLQSRR